MIDRRSLLAGCATLPLAPIAFAQSGPLTRIGRVWADGTLIDLTQFTTRFYPGDEAQSFDPLIDAIEYGRELIPLTRKLIAERGAARGVAAE